jgi:hypothetical protein
MAGWAPGLVWTFLEKTLAPLPKIESRVVQVVAQSLYLPVYQFHFTIFVILNVKRYNNIVIEHYQCAILNAQILQ